MPANSLVFGPPTIEAIGEPALLVEVRRRSFEKLNEDCTEANRYKDNGIIAEPEKRAEFLTEWREAVDKAQARHAARLAYVEHEILGRPRPPKAPPRPVAVPQFSAEGYDQAKAQAERAQAETEAKKDRESADHQRSARLWFDRHLADIKATVAQPKPTPITAAQWYGHDGLQQRYLNKLAIAAAKTDGHIFTEDF